MAESGDDLVAGSRRAARPGRGRRRRDPRRRAGHRRRARRSGRDRGLHRPDEQHRHAALRLRPARDDRGDRRAGHRSSAAPGSRSPVDHLDPTRSRRSPTGIERDHGHIDVLVNDIWGGEVLKGGPAEWDTPIWEHDLDDGLRILRLAIDTHLITSHHLLPLLVDRPGGLLVEVTDGTTAYNADALPDLGLLRPGQGRGEPAGVLAGPRAGAARRRPPSRSRPGWMRSEMMLEAFGVDRGDWRDALGDGDGAPAPPGFALSESPRYVGPGGRRAGRRPRPGPLEPAVGRLRGSSAASYGFTDVDGSRPDVWPIIEAADPPALIRSLLDSRTLRWSGTRCRRPSSRSRGSRMWPRGQRRLDQLPVTGPAGRKRAARPFTLALRAPEVAARRSASRLRRTRAGPWPRTTRHPARHQLPEHLVVEARRQRHGVRVPRPARADTDRPGAPTGRRVSETTSARDARGRPHPRPVPREHLPCACSSPSAPSNTKGASARASPRRCAS